jgi:hypothetical protein
MISKTFLNYFKYSGVWISFALNPYHWRIWLDFNKPDDMDPGRYTFNIGVGPVAVKVVLDDGSW